MPNLEAIITSHNKQILEKDQREPEKPCNCQKKEWCPLKNKSCQERNVVYKATVETSKETKTYIGLSSTAFKQRWYLHKSHFNDNKKRYATALTNHVQNLKDKGEDHKISWKIIARAQEAKPGKRTCRLCLKEAREILRNDNKKESLNKRTEVTGSCIHMKKFYLSQWGNSRKGRKKKK